MLDNNDMFVLQLYIVSYFFFLYLGCSTLTFGEHYSSDVRDRVLAPLPWTLTFGEHYSSEVRDRVLAPWLSPSVRGRVCVCVCVCCIELGCARG